MKLLQILKTHKVKIVLLVVVLGLVFYALTARAVTRTWDGGGGDNNWSTCANWSSDTCPTSSDLALFDGTSDKNATIDGSFGGSVQGLQITSNYDGTITQSRSLTIGTAHFSQAGGTFEQGTQTFDINSGSFTVSGGTFNSGAATSTIELSFTHSGGTYNATNRVVVLDGGAGANSTLTCTGTASGSFGLAKTSDNNTSLTLVSGCTANFVNINSSYGDVTINGTANFASKLDVDESFTVGSAGTITFGVGNPTINIEENLTLTSGSTFNATGMTVNFDGTFGNNSTFTCTGTFSGTVTFLKTSDNNTSFTLASGCTANFGNIASTYGDVTINGTANFASILDLDESLTVGSAGTITFSSTTPTINIEESLTLTSGSTFNATGMTVNFNGSFGNNSTFTCTGTFSGLVNISKTSNNNSSFTLASGCTANFVSSVSTDGNVTINGTANFGSSLNVDESLIIGSSGTITFSSGSPTITVENSFTINSGGTFNATGMVLTLDGGAGAVGTFTCTGTFSGTVNITKSSTNNTLVTIASGCTVNAAQNISTSGGVTVNGTFALAGYNLSALTVTVGNGGTLRAHGSQTITTPTFNTGSTMEYYGTGSYTTLPAGTLYANLLISGSGTWDLSTRVTVSETYTQTAGTFEAGSSMIVEDFVLSGGTYVAPASTLIVGDDFTHTAGTFTHNSGTVKFGAGAHLLTTAASTVFYNLSLGDTSLAAHWKFDEGSGSSAADSSGFGNTGTLVAMEAGDWSTTDKAPLTGNVASLDANASGEYVSVSVDIGSAWTIASWFKWPLESSASSYNTLTRGTNDHTILVQRSNNVLGYWDNAGGSGFNSSTYDMDALSNGWHHIAAVGVSTTSVTRFYIDGVLVGSAARKSTDNILALGNYQGGTTQQWGKMDDLRVYSRDLTGSDVAALYAGNEPSAPSGGTITLAGDVLDVANDLTIESGTLDVSTNGCGSSPCNIEVGGDWSNAGTFTARTGTVTLDGSNQTISGSTTFYNLTKTVASAASLTFEASETQTIDGTLTLTGGGTGSRLSLQSSSPATQWNIAPEGTRSINYLTVTDGNNTSGEDIICWGAVNCTNGGNNVGFVFSDPSLLGPRVQLNGGVRFGGVRLQ